MVVRRKGKDSVFRSGSYIRKKKYKHLGRRIKRKTIFSTLDTGVMVDIEEIETTPSNTESCESKEILTPSNGTTGIIHSVVNRIKDALERMKRNRRALSSNRSLLRYPMLFLDAIYQT